MATWKEIERLRADLETAQTSVAVQKLSERNCIEILIKLQEMKLLDVIHTIDGKEYLTQSQLVREIRDELYIHGGRVSLAELQTLLNVDYSHIEAKANEIVSSNKSIYIVLGQLVDKTYLDNVAEEINDTLQSMGEVTIADICKTYDLPGDFLLPELMDRLGYTINGRLDEMNKDAIFTESFIARHKARIRGMLTGMTRPTNLQPIMGQMSSKLFYAIIDELLAEKRISGDIVNRRSDKPSFLPDIYIRTQNQYVDNFYQQNNYLEYETLSRLDIPDPKSYIHRRYKGVLLLTSVCVGPSIISLAAATVEDTLSSGQWTDIRPLLPSPFTIGDCTQLLQHVLKEHCGKKAKDAKGFVVGTIIACKSFIESCTSYFTAHLNEKADKKTKHAAVFSMTKEEIKHFSISTEGKSKTERRDERRKRATEGSGSTKRVGDGGSGGGAGIGAREVKTKGKDKKRQKKQRELEAQIEEREASVKQGSHKEDIFMEVEEIISVLEENLHDCPEEFLQEIAEQIQRPLDKSYQELSKSIFQLAMSEQQENRSCDLGEDLDKRHGHLPAAASQKKSRKHHEEEINSIWCNIKLFSEALENFEGDLLSQLERHLVRTACSDLVNILFNMIGSEYLTGLEESNKMTAEIRAKILTRLPNEYQTPMKNLHQSVLGKTLDDFNSALTAACSRDVCSIMLKKIDKKRERQIMHSHKMSLLKQLEIENDPAMVFHLAVVIIFQSVTGRMLHIPGKCVPSIVSVLKENIPEMEYAQIINFQSLVMQKLTTDAAEQDSGQVSEAIDQALPELRILAATLKKKKLTNND